MLPTVDICFKNLMDNPDVRKGFIAALLRRGPGEISKTTLLPTTLKREYGDDKLGILDVLILLQTERRSIWRCRWHTSTTGMQGFSFIWKDIYWSAKKGGLLRDTEKMYSCEHSGLYSFYR